MQRSNKMVNSSSKKDLKKFGYYIPIIFCIVVIPLLVYGKVIEFPIEVANFWKGGTILGDFFIYYKSIAIIVGTLASLAAFGGLFLNNKLTLQKEKKYYVPMAIYLTLVVMSAIMANNKYVALFGFIEMHQGVFVLMCYILLTFILINYTITENDVKVFMYSIAVLIAIEGFIGISQYFGFDIFQTYVGRKLITPRVLENSLLNFTFGRYTIYGTMYNTNYIGSFGALVLPISTILYLSFNNIKKTAIFGLTAILAFATWLGCNSRAGYLGITCSLIIGVIIFRKVIKDKYIKIIKLLIMFIIVVIIFNTASEGKVLNQFLKLSPVTEAEKLKDVQKQREVIFEEVSIKNNEFKIKTNKETLIGLVEDSSIIFKDETGNSLGVKTDKFNNVKFVDEEYSNYIFTLNSPNIQANIYGRVWHLFITPDENIKVISFNNKLTDPEKAPRIKLFDGRETFASKRGYIWSRTIPMIKDTLIIGYGPDNYPMVFPQEDYVGRFNVGSNGMTDIVIDKPHNMYFQTAINTGVISLLALLSIWGIYLFDSFKIYIKGNMDSFTEYMGAAIFLGIVAYLVAGLFNDSVVSVAPLFWILLGIGIGVNRMVKNNN